MRKVLFVLLHLILLSANDFFGTGDDGDLTIESGQTYFVDQVKAAVIGDNNTGTTSVQVENTTGFLPGDEILLITMQDASSENFEENNTGYYEFNIVSSIELGIINLELELEFTYNQSGSQLHQIIKVPNFSNVYNEGTITSTSWNHSTGGILCFKVSGEMVNNGLVTVSGLGYTGGPIGPSWNSEENRKGYQGESIFGLGTQDNLPNQNGGGGASTTTFGHAGGGGGHINSGSIGYSYINHNYFDNNHFGQGGSSVFTNNWENKLLFGGGGGAGAWDNNSTNGDSWAPGNGGNGGGCILIHSKFINNSGAIDARGYDGDDYYYPGIGYHAGGGGGGAGGTIKITSHMEISNSINSSGGNGGQGWSTYGGNGSNGRNILTRLPLTWHVSTTGSDETGDGSEENPFATIQAGIDATSDGDTVLVSAGTYNESIIMQDGITLLGLGYENTTIQSDSYYVIQPADNTEISFFSLIGNGTSSPFPCVINLDNYDGDGNIKITNNKFYQNCRFGIRAYSPDGINNVQLLNNIFTGINFTNNFYSIGILHYQNVNNSEIKNNIFHDYSVNPSSQFWGVEISSGTNHDVSENHFNDINISSHGFII